MIVHVSLLADLKISVIKDLCSMVQSIGIHKAGKHARFKSLNSSQAFLFAATSVLQQSICCLPFRLFSVKKYHSFYAHTVPSYRTTSLAKKLH